MTSEPSSLYSSFTGSFAAWHSTQLRMLKIRSACSFGSTMWCWSSNLITGGLSWWWQA